MKITAVIIVTLCFISCVHQEDVLNELDFLITEPIEKAHYIRFDNLDDGIYEAKDGGREFVSIDNIDTLYTLKEIPSINSSFITNTVIGEKSKIVEFYINLNSEGTKTLMELTKRNIDKEIYIVYKGKIISHPFIFGIVDKGVIWIEMDKELFHSHFSD